MGWLEHFRKRTTVGSVFDTDWGTREEHVYLSGIGIGILEIKYRRYMGID